MNKQTTQRKQPAPRRVKITGVGKELPSRVVTSAELETRLKLEPNWIHDKTGIRERRHVVQEGPAGRPQVKAMADNVQGKVKALGAKVSGVEGAQNAEWILIDLGTVVVHVMLPAIRAHYNLEELWSARPARKTSRKRAASAADAAAE